MLSILKRTLASLRSEDKQVYRLTHGIRRLSSIRSSPSGRLKIFPLLDQLASNLGFVLYNQSLSWINDSSFNGLWQSSPYAGKQRPDRKFVAYSAARSTRHLQGDTAECGVLDGATSYIILFVNQGTKKHHFMFDSWQGLSEPNEVDKEIPADSAYRWKAGDLKIDLQRCKENLKDYSNKTFYQGWIPNEFRHVANHSFSFVHIDVDLYQPTLDSLQFFWPRMQKGGIVLCDDYGYESCPGARCACDEFFSGQVVPLQMIHLPTGQSLITK